MPRPLAVSRPPALPVARFETVLFARLECVGTLRLQRSIRNSGWREEGEDEHVFILRVIRIAYFGALRYIRAASSNFRTSNDAVYSAMWWL